jgi:hypothetical protein
MQLAGKPFRGPRRPRTYDQVTKSVANTGISLARAVPDNGDGNRDKLRGSEFLPFVCYCRAGPVPSLHRVPTSSGRAGGPFQVRWAMPDAAASMSARSHLFLHRMAELRWVEDSESLMQAMERSALRSREERSLCRRALLEGPQRPRFHVTVNCDRRDRWRRGLS